MGLFDNTFTNTSASSHYSMPGIDFSAEFKANVDNMNADMWLNADASTREAMREVNLLQELEYERLANEKTTRLQNGLENGHSWDPRLRRLDGFISSNVYDGNATVIVPFGTETAASAYKDRKFMVPEGSFNSMSGDQSANDVRPFNGPQLRGQGEHKGTAKWVHMSGAKDGADPEKADPRYFGLASLMNPYSLTTLCGSLTGTPQEERDGTVSFTNEQNQIYDVRDSRRFYDLTKNDSGTVDILSVSNPTTSNIIKYSNADPWGRTPYAFQDFVYCKWWNVIPNNRLITLRKYQTPCVDNLTFYGMYKDSTNESGQAFPPIATVVTYFGGESGNSLKSILEFTTGVEWGELDGSELHKVTGEAGSNPQALADQYIQRGETNTGSTFLDAIGKTGLSMARNYVSLGKALGFFSPGFFSASRTNAQHLNAAQQDPFENGPLSNKILGPVNVITKVKKRNRGLTFSQGGLSIVCTYSARAIGSINPKAAILDIMSNCLVLGSANAMFWGGGYRFDIAPRDYPYNYNSNGDPLNITSFLSKVAQGNLFGSDGAIATAFSGIKKIGTDDNGEFSFGAVIENIGNVFSDALKGIGGFIQDAVNNIFNANINLIDGDTPSGEGKPSPKQKVANWFKAAVGNASEMYKSEIMKETVFPAVQGFRSLLSGEPTGNWHLTIGNPLNPICVIGNLICKDVKISFSDELGPDDFPVEMTATFTLEHAMGRDAASIQSMFNRGNGRIYKLPDYINATSDHESHVDNFTGQETDFMKPKFMGPGLWGASVGKSYKLASPIELATSGDASGMINTKFTAFDRDGLIGGAVAGIAATRFKNELNVQGASLLPAYRAHATARKELR